MIYDTLLQLPIFQGISAEQLTSIIEKTPFQFRKFKEGEVIAERGEICDRLVFVLNGTVRLEMPTFDGRVLITQEMEGPHTMPFYYLFGAQTTLPGMLIACTDVGIMELDKQHFLKLLQSNEIPLVNVLNMLSTHAQKQHLALDFAGKISDVERLASWLLAYTERASKNIYVTANEEDWCLLLHAKPAEFWRAVAIFEGKGVIESSGGVLKLIDRYALRSYVNFK